MTERFQPSGGLPQRGPLALAQPAPYVPKADCLRAWVAFYRAQYDRLPSVSWLARKSRIHKATVGRIVTREQILSHSDTPPS